MTPFEQRLKNLQAYGNLGATKNGSVSTYNPQGQYRAAVAQARQKARPKAAKGDLQAQLRERLEGVKGKEKPSGKKQFLGQLANVAKEPAKALSYAAGVSGRSVVSTLKETADLFTDEDASFGDLKSQINDQSFGFGTAVGNVTGNKWIDGAIGFAGDVALDPLSYVTFGAGRFVGAAGRLAATEQLAAKGFGKEALARVGKFGVNKATKAEREALDLGESGLRFMGGRIPGTSGVADNVGGALSGARAGLGDKFGGGLQKRIGAQELAGARRGLATGGREGSSVEDAVAQIITHNQKRAVRSEANTLGKRMEQRWKGVSANDRVAATHAIEAGRGVKGGSPFDEVADWARGEGIEVPTLASGKPYVPHITTREGSQFLRDLSGGDIFLDELQASGRTQQRKLVAGGTYDIGGETINLVDGTLAEIEQKLQAAFPKSGVKKFYEDDLGTLSQRYVENLTKDVAVARGLKMVGRPVADVSSPKLDPQATGAATTALEQIDRDWLAALKGDRSSALASGIDEFDKARVATRGQARRGIDDIIKGIPAQRDALGAARADVDRLTRSAESASGKVGRSGARLSKMQNELTELRRKKVKGIADKKEAIALKQDMHDELLREAGVVNVGLEQARKARQDVNVGIREARQSAERLRQAGIKLERRVPTTAGELLAKGVELETVIAAVAKDADFAPVQHLLDSAAKQMMEVENLGWSMQATRKLIADGRAGQVAPIVNNMLNDGWTQVGQDILAEGDGIAVRTSLAKAFKTVEKELNTGGVWKVFDGYTQFFKTYATLTPGFHLRNLMGATFMNFSDGVGSASMLRSLNLWRKHTADPDWVGRQSDEIQRAFKATYASGAGGHVSAEELYGVAGPMGKLTDNKATKAGKKAGEWVEGPVRLAMALDSVGRKGMGDAEALARITRVHFDYSQLSEFDRYAKRVLPFYTFMSRNLPLQIQQIMQKPKTYQRYSHFVKNIREDEDGDVVPLYWEEGGAFKVADGNYMMPDLQHLNLAEDIAKLDLRDPMRLLSEFNPVVRVPAELAMDKKFFYDSPFQEDESKLKYAAENLNPIHSQGKRLSADNDKRLQTVLNYLGIPLKQLTPSQVKSEQRRRKYDD